MDALAHSLEKPETLLPAYALLNRIRLCASPAVLAEAENVLRRVTEQYFAKNLPVEQIRAARPLQGRRSAEGVRRGVSRGAEGHARRRIDPAPNPDQMPTLC